MTDDPNIDPRLRSAFERLAAGLNSVPSELQNRVSWLLRAEHRSRIEPSWMQDVEPIATFEARVPTVTTRDEAGVAVLEPVQTTQLPVEFDEQINFDFDGDELRIEVEVDPSIGELWVSITIGGFTVAAPFDPSSDDERIRVAQVWLPEDVVAPLVSNQELVVTLTFRLRTR
jgi:hypothetical protein